MSEPSEIDVGNHHVVGVQGEYVVIFVPPRRLLKKDALAFAAWIVAMADQSLDHADFREILRRVENS